MYKRQAISEATSTELPSTTPSGDEPVVENLVYAATKALLVTTEAPVLRIRGNKVNEDVVYELNRHTLVTADERSDVLRLAIIFSVNDKKNETKKVRERK